MDFSQFLVQNPDIPNDVKEITPKTIKQNYTLTDKTTIELKKPNKQTESNYKKVKKDKHTKDKPIIVQPHIHIEEQQPQKEFKKGDFVIIKGVPNSSLNVYKGYFGEIKEYIQRTESAYIILEAMNYPRKIKFPIGHFVHRTF